VEVYRTFGGKLKIEGGKGLSGFKGQRRGGPEIISIIFFEFIFIKMNVKKCWLD